MAKYLVRENANVRIYDPKVTDEQIEMDLTEKDVCSPEDYARRVSVVHDPYECASGVDAVVVVTEWDEFRRLDYERIFSGMNKPACVFDGRLILDHARLRAIGFTVEAIGKRVD
ncbi:hypothetical protein HK405_015201 [Cladochytrium tenue]|nr:hypothetical protein HK405_015201 [Cladochytrium tenue]